MPEGGWWEALWSDPARVLRDAGVASGMEAIDLCCGNGWFTVPLCQMARRVIAIDVDRTLLDAAQASVRRAGASNCTFVESDAYELPRIVRRPVDHVFLANAFHGVPDKPRLARAVHSVLKPGGLFAVVNWHARPRDETIVLGEPRGPATELRMTPEQTIRGIEPGGLRFRDQVEVSPFHYGAIFERPR